MAFKHYMHCVVLNKSGFRPVRELTQIIRALQPPKMAASRLTLMKTYPDNQPVAIPTPNCFRGGCRTNTIKLLSTAFSTLLLSTPVMLLISLIPAVSYYTEIAGSHVWVCLHNLYLAPCNL